MEISNEKKEIIKQLEDFDCIKISNEREFKLKSGEFSNIYINTRNALADPKFRKFISLKLLSLIANIDYDYIIGVPYSGILIAIEMSNLSNKKILIVKKEEKNYGFSQEFKIGAKVIIVEDVINSGSSVLETKKKLESRGLKIQQILTIIDRHSLQTLFNFKSLLTLNEILDNYKQKKQELVIALDLNLAEEIINFIENYCKNIKMIKLHIDTIIFKSENEYLKFCNILFYFKNKYNFSIIEDRKFSDIGNTVLKQLKAYQYYYQIIDIITVQVNGGQSVLKGISEFYKSKSKKIGILIVSDMSSFDSFNSNDYKEYCVNIANDSINIPNIFIEGFVGQSKTDKMKHFGYKLYTPGVRIKEGKDNLDQKYNLIKKESDFIIVGRDITESKNPEIKINDYLLKLGAINVIV